MNKYSNAYRILSHMFGGRSRRAARPRHTLSRRARRMSSGSTRPPPRTALCVTAFFRDRYGMREADWRDLGPAGKRSAVKYESLHS